MTWLVYENADESTQIFIGVLLILAITVVIGANIYFWVYDKIKKSKQK
jgi:FlaG/FlaF family flagellin (archaellin)